MKYCKCCGALLFTKGAALIEPLEERFDEYLIDLFWVTVWGPGLILGGIALMKKVQLSSGLIIAYMILNSLVSLIMFALHL
jgi:hypothetical protein